MKRALAVAGVCLLAAVAPLFAQDAQPGAAPPAVDPDRPDITNSAHIVATGLLQIEFGGQYVTAAAGEGAFGSPFTARVGLREWIEARLGTDGLLVQTDGLTRTVGVGNVQAGAKIRLLAGADGVGILSLLPAVNLPTASAEKGLGSGHADYTIALLTGTDFAARAHVDVNYALGAIGGSGDAQHFVQHLASVSASDALSDRWNPYIEAYWFSRVEAGGPPQALLDAGAICQLSARYAVDGGLQLGLNAGAPRFGAFGGLSILVGDVLGSFGPTERRRQAERRRAAAGQ